MAYFTAASSACTRWSMAVALPDAVMIFQPVACNQVCHWEASAASISAIAGVFAVDGALA